MRIGQALDGGQVGLSQPVLAKFLQNPRAEEVRAGMVRIDPNRLGKRFHGAAEFLANQIAMAARLRDHGLMMMPLSAADGFGNLTVGIALGDLLSRITTHSCIPAMFFVETGSKIADHLQEVNPKKARQR